MSTHLSKAQAENIIQSTRDWTSPKPTKATMLCAERLHPAIFHMEGIEKWPWTPAAWGNQLIDRRRPETACLEDILPAEFQTTNGDATRGPSGISDPTPRTPRATMEMAPTDGGPINPAVEMPASPSPYGNMTVKEAQEFLAIRKGKGRPSKGYLAQKAAAEFILREAQKLGHLQL